LRAPIAGARPFFCEKSFPRVKKRGMHDLSSAFIDIHHSKEGKSLQSLLMRTRISGRDAMLDVFAYALFVVAMIGLLRYVMHGIESQSTTPRTPERDP
jgi:hypothetical protein